MKLLRTSALALLLSGCAIADKSDKFGAEIDLGIGGILSYIADIHLKASVGFSKTCPQEVEQHETLAELLGRPGGDRRGFL